MRQYLQQWVGHTLPLLPRAGAGASISAFSCMKVMGATSRCAARGAAPPFAPPCSARRAAAAAWVPLPPLPRGLAAAGGGPAQCRCGPAARCVVRLGVIIARIRLSKTLTMPEMGLSFLEMKRGLIEAISKPVLRGAISRKVPWSEVSGSISRTSRPSTPRLSFHSCPVDINTCTDGCDRGSWQGLILTAKGYAAKGEAWDIGSRGEKQPHDVGRHWQRFSWVPIFFRMP